MALLGWAIRRGGGLGHILAESSRLQQGSTPFWQLFPAALTANVGYWATLSLNIPDFTRYARSQRSQVLGQALGLPTTMTAFAFIGVAVTSATIVDLRRGDLGSGRADRAHRQPAGDHLRRAGRAGGAADDQHGGQRRVAGQRLLEPGAAAHQLRDGRADHRGASASLMMPWKLYADAGAYIFTWLIGYSSLMGAIGGILIADYWVLRGRELSLRDLFEPNGRYAYTNGVNWRGDGRAGPRDPAGAARLRARGDDARRRRSPNPTFFDALYTYAWFVTFALSFVHLPAADATGTLTSRPTRTAISTSQVSGASRGATGRWASGHGHLTAGNGDEAGADDSTATGPGSACMRNTTIDRANPVSVCAVVTMPLTIASPGQPAKFSVSTPRRRPAWRARPVDAGSAPPAGRPATVPGTRRTAAGRCCGRSRAGPP